MVNYESIISLLSIMLILIILFVVIFGCRCPHYYERFTNEEEKKEKKGNEKFISEMEEKMKGDKLMGDGGDLSQYEKTILEGLTKGSITTETFTNLVKTEKFTENNLNNLIAYVEKHKGGLGIEEKK